MPCHFCVLVSAANDITFTTENKISSSKLGQGVLPKSMGFLLELSNSLVAMVIREESIVLQFPFPLIH